MSFKPLRAWRAASGPADLVFDFKIIAHDFFSYIFLKKGYQVFQAAAGVACNIWPCGPCV